MIKTVLTPFRSAEESTVPFTSDYQALKDLVMPHLDGGDWEHVAVLYQGKRCSMFVDEMGHKKADGPLPFNERATLIYRAASLERDPELSPGDLPTIVGPAILFDENVWV